MNLRCLWLRSPALAGVFVCAALWLTGCATPQVRDLAQAWPAGLPTRASLEHVPFVAQEEYECGPASLAMVLQSTGQNVSAESLVPQVYLPGRQGSLQVEMQVAARRAGVLATPLEPTLEAVLREVAAGHPVLVFQNLSLPWYPVWHYAVVVGYDREAQTLVLHSGVTPRMPISFSAFDRTWERGQRWALVATRPAELPVTASADAVAQALVALERLQPAAAQKGYTAALARWPDHRTFLLGAGNSAYAQGNLKAAQVAYAHAVQVDPLFAAAWNNLAQVELERGELLQAQDAVSQALRLSPAGDTSLRALERTIAQTLAALRSGAEQATPSARSETSAAPTSPPRP